MFLGFEGATFFGLIGMLLLLFFDMQRKIKESKLVLLAVACLTTLFETLAVAIWWMMVRPTFSNSCDSADSYVGED